jgi:hypothetical protein
VLVGIADREKTFLQKAAKETKISLDGRSEASFSSLSSVQKPARKALIIQQL